MRKSKFSPDTKLPIQHAPGPVGAFGRLTPSRHENAILRRVAQPGAFLLVTFRGGKSPLYTYEDGTPIRDDIGRPLSEKAFARLEKFLDAERGDSLFPDGPPQRYNARRL